MKNENFHHGGTKFTETAKRNEIICINKIKNFLRDLRISVVKLHVVLVLLVPFLQGCTLLFVEKGSTRYLETKAPQTPPAKSLSPQMSQRVVLKYKVQEGDTLDSIAFLYYGHTSKAEKLARANHLTPGNPLKKGRVLLVPDPLHYPNPKDLVKKKEHAWSEEAGLPKGPISHLDKTPEKITAIPRPKFNNAFAPGEKLKFEVRALGMVGGYGTLEVGSSVTVQGRPCFPLSAQASTAFPFSALFQVKDVQTSYFDPVDFLTWKFENNVLEGKHKAQNFEIYDQIRHKAVRSHNAEPPEEMDVAPFTQDIISCFYYFRLLPMKVGETYSIPTQAAGQNYNLIVEVIKKEKITLATGAYDCVMIKPHVRYATVFRNTDDIDIWLTDDERHMPVLVRSAIFIGHVEAKLLEATLPKLVEAPKTHESQEK
jgi:phage tail protein X